MRGKSPLLRACWSGVVLVTCLAGCLIVSPLEDHPEPQGFSGGGGKSSQAGSSSPSAGEAGEPSGGHGPSSEGCQTNEDCVRPGAGAPYRCRQSDHKCVQLSSDECPVVLGPAEDPSAIYFGAFATLNPLAPDKNTIFWSHELAREQLSSDEAGGLRGRDGGPARPLVIVGCNNADASIEPALKHLVENVEVPALIATLKPGDMRRAYEAYRASKLFYLSPVPVTKTLIQDEPDGLIWNLLGQPADLAPAYAELLRLSEQHVRRILDLEAAEPIRVVLVTTLDAFDSELADSVRPLLQFNDGKSTTKNGGNYKDFTVNPSSDLAELGLQIAQFRPHIVISAASDAFTKPEGLIDHIEFEWAAAADDLLREPFYILSPYNAGDLGYLQSNIDKGLKFSGSDMYTRFIGLSIAGARDISLQNIYANKLLSRFPNAYTDSANYYDAVYFLAYAMYGSSDTGALTGPGIADGMKRLLSGDPFDIGAMAINDVFDALDVEGATLQLNSTLGPPSFDPETGVRPVDGGVFCFSRENEQATSTQRELDVLRYDRDLEHFGDAEFPCFTFP
ncbi:MAG TPA: hypothetical protein VJN18_10895 [Polyangiaceae bacterium]|nr:hypothetical protein [Polyangiaceae bacterium]